MPLFTFSPRNALLGALLLVLGAGFFFMLRLFWHTLQDNVNI